MSARSFLEALELRTLLSALPISPTNVFASPVDGRRVDVQWVDNSDNESSFRIERSSNGTTFSTLQSVGANVTSFRDSTATPSTTFTYRLTATNTVGDSLSQNAPAVTTPSIPELAPAAPSNLRFTLNGNSATLAWDDNSSDETKFLVQQQGGFFFSFFSIVETVADQTSVTIPVSNDVPLQFRVKAFNPQGGDSPVSNSVNVLAVPNTPQNVLPSAASLTSIRVNWQAFGATTQTFTVQRFDAGEWNTIGTTTERTFLDQNLPANSTHSYRVIAANATGSSAPSAVVIGSTLLPRVTGLRGTSITSNSVALAWDDVGGELSFRIERSDDGVNFTTLRHVVANQTTFTDTNLPSGRQFTYRIAAVMFLNGEVAPASDALTVFTLGRAKDRWNIIGSQI